MKICLAATSDKNFIKNLSDSKFILESFYYVQEWQKELIKNCDLFLLDSGAFTFFSSGKRVDWAEYLDKYAEFINKNNIQHFFELDIDAIVGYETVLKFRKTLESKTNKKCIPVWHKARGLEEFYKMCDEYNYVAVGGIVSKEIKPQDYKYLTHLISEAHKRGAKIHGLGFTSVKELPKYKFDSVDSTTWKSGGRFGQLHIFKDGEIKIIKPKNTRAKDYKKIDEHNFNEWVKYQKYAERRL